MVLTEYLAADAILTARNLIYEQDAYATELDVRFVFRNRFHHCLRVADIAVQIATAEHTNVRVAAYAALFHDVGKSSGADHGPIGAELVAAHLPSLNLTPAEVDAIVDCVRNHSAQIPLDQGCCRDDLAVLRDADLIDEVGALGIAWTLMGHGLQEPRSYHSALSALEIHHNQSIWVSKTDSMLTTTGRNIMSERVQTETKFIDNLREELSLAGSDRWGEEM